MKKTVSVYGYGRFGSLWADILKADFKVQVYSRRILKQDEVADAVIVTDLPGLFDCDALFYCVSISSLETVLKESSPHIDTERTIVFDTCSVKVRPAEWMKNELPSGTGIIATHPMFGPDSYDGSESRPLVIANVSAPADEYKSWWEYFRQKGLKVQEMTPDEHDRQAAYSQGITHYIGRVLADLDLKPGKIDTLGYSKLLNIIEQTCNDDWQLFLDLQRYNPYTVQMREDLHKSIEKIYSFLRSQADS